MNAWDYRVIFKKDLKSTDEIVNICLDIMHRFGFTPFNSVGKILIMSWDGLDDHQLDNLADAKAYLSQKGGNMTLWGPGEVDISITFVPRPDQPTHSLSAHIENTFYRLDRAAHQQMFDTMLNIYKHLCEAYTPIYGYSTDETVLDQFWEEVKDFRVNPDHPQKPPILFWLNYFSNEYGASLNFREPERLGGKITRLSQGFMVSFLERPEELSIAKLEQINRIWWQM